MRDNFAQERHDLTALRCPLNSLHIQMVYALAADLPAPKRGDSEYMYEQTGIILSNHETNTER
jgi:hypothetical protein